MILLPRDLGGEAEGNIVSPKEGKLLMTVGSVVIPPFLLPLLGATL